MNEVNEKETPKCACMYYVCECEKKKRTKEQIKPVESQNNTSQQTNSKWKFILIEISTNALYQHRWATTTLPPAPIIR